MCEYGLPYTRVSRLTIPWAVVGFAAAMDNREDREDREDRAEDTGLRNIKEAELRALVRFLKGFSVATLTSVGEDGYPHSCLFKLRESLEDLPLWFVLPEKRHLLKHLLESPKVNVSAHRTADHSWISIAGFAQILTDTARAEQLLSEEESPDQVVIRVSPVSASYWEPGLPQLRELFDLRRPPFSDQDEEERPSHTFVVDEREVHFGHGG